MSQRSRLSCAVIPASETAISSGSCFAFGRRVIIAAGIARKLLQKIAILRRAEILRHAVFAPESQRVAAQIRLVLTGRGFRHIGAWLIRRV